MIELKNLTKIYKSQSKQDVIANNNISLSFSEKGLIFIVGESGSGKTTLLNILAGLDTQTSGQYIINGKDIKSFKSLDDFRNQCVGFIFQDFNLIEYLTVYENIELVLSLQQQTDKTKISNILEEVGLKDYENRKINELSGGQKQRVAIARALVKDSDFILADEPTGNLDSKNSKEIFDLLKKISNKKLVIVVSHNQELAKQYAGQIIELKDGKVNDILNISKKIQKKSNKEMANHKTKSLSNNYIFKLGFYNIKNHLWKNIISVAMFVFTIFSICIGQCFLSYNAENSITKTFGNTSQNYYFAQSIYDNKDGYNAVEFDSYAEINDAVYSSFKNNEIPFLKGYNLPINDASNEKYLSNCFYVITSKNDVEKLGIEFYSASPITDNGVYLTDYVIDYLLFDECKLSVNTDDYSKMCGLSLLEYDATLNVYVQKYKINGVIKTDYKEYFNNKFDVVTDYDKTKFNSADIFKNYAYQKRNVQYLPIFVNENYVKDHFAESKIDFLQNGFRDIFIALGNHKTAIDGISIIDNANYNYQTIYEGKVCSQSNIELQENEILINLGLYNKLFDEIKYNEIRSHIFYDEYGNEVCDYDFAHINEYITLNVKNSMSNETNLQISNKKIVGVVIKTYDLSKNDGNEIYTNNSTIKNNALYSNTNNIICSRISNKSHFEQLIKFYRINFNIGLKDIQAESIYDLEQTAQMISFIFLGLSIIFGFIAVLTTINVISLSINNKKKEIGILRALGTKNKDIEKIFIFQNFVVSLFSFVISMGFVYLGVFFINIILSLNSIANTIYLIANIYCWLIAFGVSFVLSFVACIIPLKIINKMNPIDSIKCIN